ncbi:hypothetical protein [Micromonospora sp. 4G55]|uniref:hypothetical protein n=1 Tax=Micromonospora sp. 4G55 TaxID=2806102 RepID=UPI001A43E148|nr:hypothetical protein [Micromonospora sp. 4G55]MBM0256061.1 hypothetical protein [Micromonospora sp. 4G55]
MLDVRGGGTGEGGLVDSAGATGEELAVALGVEPGDLLAVGCGEVGVGLGGMEGLGSDVDMDVLGLAVGADGLDASIGVGEGETPGLSLGASPGRGITAVVGSAAEALAANPEPIQIMSPAVTAAELRSNDLMTTFCQRVFLMTGWPRQFFGHRASVSRW